MPYYSLKHEIIIYDDLSYKKVFFARNLDQKLRHFIIDHCISLSFHETILFLKTYDVQTDLTKIFLFHKKSIQFELVYQCTLLQNKSIFGMPPFNLTWTDDNNDTYYLSDDTDGYRIPNTVIQDFGKLDQSNMKLIKFKIPKNAISLKTNTELAYIFGDVIHYLLLNMIVMIDVSDINENDKIVGFYSNRFGTFQDYFGGAIFENDHFLPYQVQDIWMHYLVIKKESGLIIVKTYDWHNNFLDEVVVDKVYNVVNIESKYPFLLMEYQNQLFFRHIRIVDNCPIVSQCNIPHRCENVNKYSMYIHVDDHIIDVLGHAFDRNMNSDVVGKMICWINNGEICCLGPIINKKTKSEISLSFETKSFYDDNYIGNGEIEKVYGDNSISYVKYRKTTSALTYYFDDVFFNTKERAFCALTSMGDLFVVGKSVHLLHYFAYLNHFDRTKKMNKFKPQTPLKTHIDCDVTMTIPMFVIALGAQLYCHLELSIVDSNKVIAIGPSLLDDRITRFFDYFEKNYLDENGKFKIGDTDGHQDSELYWYYLGKTFRYCFSYLGHIPFVLPYDVLYCYALKNKKIDDLSYVWSYKDDESLKSYLTDPEKYYEGKSFQKIICEYLGVEEKSIAHVTKFCDALFNSLDLSIAHCFHLFCDIKEEQVLLTKEHFTDSSNMMFPDIIFYFIGLDEKNQQQLLKNWTGSKYVKKPLLEISKSKIIKFNMCANTLNITEEFYEQPAYWGSLLIDDDDIRDFDHTITNSPLQTPGTMWRSRSVSPIYERPYSTQYTLRDFSPPPLQRSVSPSLERYRPVGRAVHRERSSSVSSTQSE